MLNKNIILIASTLFITACPIDNNPVIKPTPIPSTPSTDIILTPTNVITDNLFKVEFGPTTKGVSNLGPTTKGVSNLGPTTKGVSNLKFSINFDENLVRNDISTFSTKSNKSLSIENLQLILEKDTEKIANITVIPKSQKVEFNINTNIKPDIYNLKAIVRNNFEPLNIFSKLELKSNLEVKVILYAKTLNRESLDIAIRTKNIKDDS